MLPSMQLLHRLRRHSLTLSLARVSHLLLSSSTNPVPQPQRPQCSGSLSSPPPPPSFRLFSTRSIDNDCVDSNSVFSAVESITGDSATQSLVSSGFSEVINNNSNGESIFPVEAVISLLDGYREFSGLPWWIVIASSTLAMRITLVPVVILQLQKLKRIAELFPKLPPPLPPPLSGKSLVKQLSLFRRERRAIGCPSFLWFLSSFMIQFPCFLLWVSSVRKMSLDHHPGFDCGGALWFQNLTEFPHGILGFIFPILIAGLHYTNVQISFQTSSVGKSPGIFGTLAKYYKSYLDVLTVPLFFVGYCIPQGSLVYWVTNSSLSIIQQLSLKHPAVRAKLGLPDKAEIIAANSEKAGVPGATPSGLPTKWRKISVQHLDPKELLALSVKMLSEGHKEKAIPLLRLALDKDPDYFRALIVMGQILMQKGQNAEATEYLERAVSKLFHAGHPTTVEDVDDLILASQWAGVAFIRQGKTAEGIAHLERLARIQEPEEPKSKAHYFDGLVMLGSALYNEGRKVEAAKYLRIAAAYNPAYKELLEQCENDGDYFVNDLASSRRADY